MLTANYTFATSEKEDFATWDTVTSEKKKTSPRRLAVDIAEIGLHGEVRAKLMNADTLQRSGAELGRMCERDAIVARDFRGVEEKKFVDNACVEGGAVKCVPAFEQHAENVAAAELRGNPFDAHSPSSRFSGDDFDA